MLLEPVTRLLGESKSHACRRCSDHFTSRLTIYSILLTSYRSTHVTPLHTTLLTSHYNAYFPPASLLDILLSFTTHW